MEPRRIITSNIGREACARRQRSSSCSTTCCLEGPRGFPGKDGANGANGTSGVGTFGFSSGIIAPFTEAIQHTLGQGSSSSSPISPVTVNGFSIPIPRDGTVSNFVVSAAQTTRLASSITYGYSIYRIPSSLGGTALPIQSPLFITGAPQLQLTFPATGSAVPLQASIEDITFSAKVFAGDRLGVIVSVVLGGTLSDPISPTFNASFDYNYS